MSPGKEPLQVFSDSPFQPDRTYPRRGKGIQDEQTRHDAGKFGMAIRAGTIDTAVSEKLL